MVIGNRRHVDRGTLGRGCAVERDGQIIDRDRAVGNIEGVAGVGGRKTDRAERDARRIKHRQNLACAVQRSARGVLDVDRLAFIEIGDDAMKTG